MPLEQMCSMASAIEVIHGETVIDPFRWLENRGHPETDRWIREQQKRCRGYFADCLDLDTIRLKVRAFLDVDVVDQPSRVGDRYFYRRRCRGTEQAGIYVRNSFAGEERLLIDPSAEGAFTSVSIYRISDDGSVLAYERRRGGEDKSAVRFFDVNHGRLLDDIIETGYARGLVLNLEHGGFYYCHDNPESSDKHTIRFRYFEESGPGRIVFTAPRTRDSRLLVMADMARLGVVWTHGGPWGARCDFLVTSLGGDLPWVQVFANRDPSFHPFLHKDRIFARYLTESGKDCVAEFSPGGRKIRTLASVASIPIRQISIAGDRLYTNQYDHQTSLLSWWSMDGEGGGIVDTPKDGTITLVPHRSRTERSLFYAFESFHQPPALFECDFMGKSRSFHRRSLQEGSPDPRVTRLSFSAKDGTAIPLTLVRQGDTPRGRAVPAVLTVYGGFGAPMTPQFSVLASLLMQGGACFALAHVRGGGEFGKSWHEAGSKRNRQTGIDDLIAAAEWLCGSGITTPKQLGIFGGSNAGLMVMAAMIQRPDLFGAALSIAPLLDMVRYEHFDQAAKWRGEYGTIDDPDDFRALLSYSPYHRIEDGINYPPTMFVVGDRDDRCNPAHVRKTTARLQERPNQTSPVIVDYSEERGHMPTLPLSVRVEALALRVAFLLRALGITLSEGGPREAICH
jgi:prolyl oligopeptidase